MPLDFPATPAPNDTYSYSGRSWKYNGSAWESVPSLIVLDNLLDVTLSTPSEGEVLKYNSASAVWVNGSDLEGTTINSLDDIGDVAITSASAGQFLKWNGAAWVNDSIPTINTLNDVGDVTITSATSGDFLKWNGSAWVNDLIDLGTDTTGDYVATITGGTGVASTAATTGEGTTHTLSIGQDVGTSASVQFATITTTGNLTVGGDFTVNGTTTTVNTETINLADNTITLNSNETSSPTQDAGIEVERGTSTNVSVRWNETTDRWQFTNDGTEYADIGGMPTFTTVTDGSNFVTVASFPSATYRSAEFLAQITQGSKYMLSKILVIHNGSTANYSQYGIVDFNTLDPWNAIPLSIETDIDSGSVRLRFKITDASTTTASVKILSTNIAI